MQDAARRRWGAFVKDPRVRIDRRKPVATIAAMDRESMPVRPALITSKR